jgi:transketolase
MNRRTLANAIRALSMDAVQLANSGHPGMPMGMADIAEVLWNDYLIHNPSNPHWFNRDRFVLSNGHGSMLLYSLLHLSGYPLSIEDLKQFRQLNSVTPGHPECGDTPGVETTTGPLGQGLANAVGMAIAERHLATTFNRPNFPIVDHYTYAFVGDGCLMEGISHEVCSLAGTLGLGKLIVFYDDNGISIDGAVKNWFTDNTAKRFQAYGWQVIDAIDGHDSQQIHAAIAQARQVQNQPTLICCKTQIGWGSPNLAGSEKTHGAPLGAEEIQATREQIGWPHPAFHIPTEIKQAWDHCAEGAKEEAAWQSLFDKYQQQHPELAAELLRRSQQKLPQAWAAHCEQFLQQTLQYTDKLATRKALQHCLNALAPVLPELIGGSADLTGSNGTLWQEANMLSRQHPEGNYLYYGVREFGMSAMMNGLALHGGIIPFGGTFLVFCDYARNALRMSALMRQRVIFIYTHDSIALGEDGPTHQPIEHITMLRATPNLHVWRPCDLVETAVALQTAIEREDGPSALLLTRQGLPALARQPQDIARIQQGGYILRDADQDKLDAILIATGSEVQLALAAQQQLNTQGINVRVVAMPCVEIFKQQSREYQSSVLPETVTQRIAIEAGSKESWYQFVGLHGEVIGIERFGASAPAATLAETFGFTCEQVVKKISHCLQKS